MPQLFIIIALAVGVIWFLRTLGRMPQARAGNFKQKTLGTTVMGIAGFLAMRGALNIAVPLFLLGLGLFGKSAAFPNGFPWGNSRSAGQKSRVATSVLAMELDHDTGAMNGTVLSGPLKGRLLETLSAVELQGLHQFCCAAKDQSQSLYEAWLDRAQPAWRDEWGSGATRGGGPSGGGPMTRVEALSVLGLREGASASDIKAAHKRLMKDFHPDKGGSDYLAAKINSAKDVLLGS